MMARTAFELLEDSDKPEWFTYPRPFLRLVETGLIEFRPWRILEGPLAFSRMKGLKQRFPNRDLVPFAVRTDCDDVACWERDSSQRVTVVHDFAGPGWEQEGEFESFWGWFRAAIEDFIEFEH